MTRRQAGTHCSRFPHGARPKRYPTPEPLSAGQSWKGASRWVGNWESTYLCFVLVCPEGAEAEMIQLARRWEPSVTAIYERRPPISAPDVRPPCPVTNGLRTFTPDPTGALPERLQRLRGLAGGGDVTADCPWEWGWGGWGGGDTFGTPAETMDLPPVPIDSAVFPRIPQRFFQRSHSGGLKRKKSFLKVILKSWTALKELLILCLRN